MARDAPIKCPGNTKKHADDSLLGATGRNRQDESVSNEEFAVICLCNYPTVLRNTAGNGT
jgi:hypothetical protein